VVTAYAILLGGTLMLGGRLADLLRRRRLFVAGVTVFTLSSLLSGLAWSEGSLIVFRGLQGLGGALLAPAALSIVVTTFREGRDRNIALGVWGAASGSGGPAGVLLGGLRRAPRETTRRGTERKASAVGGPRTLAHQRAAVRTQSLRWPELLLRKRTNPFARFAPN